MALTEIILVAMSLSVYKNIYSIRLWYYSNSMSLLRRRSYCICNMCMRFPYFDMIYRKFHFMEGVSIGDFNRRGINKSKRLIYVLENRVRFGFGLCECL